MPVMESSSTNSRSSSTSQSSSSSTSSLLLILQEFGSVPFADVTDAPHFLPIAHSERSSSPEPTSTPQSPLGNTSTGSPARTESRAVYTDLHTSSVLAACSKKQIHRLSGLLDQKNTRIASLLADNARLTVTLARERTCTADVQAAQAVVQEAATQLRAKDARLAALLTSKARMAAALLVLRDERDDARHGFACAQEAYVQLEETNDLCNEYVAVLEAELAAGAGEVPADLVVENRLLRSRVARLAAALVEVADVVADAEGGERTTAEDGREFYDTSPETEGDDSSQDADGSGEDSSHDSSFF